MAHEDERLPKPLREPDADERRRRDGGDLLVCLRASDDATKTNAHCAPGARQSHSNSPIFGEVDPGTVDTADSSEVSDGRAQIIGVETPDKPVCVRLPNCLRIS